MYISHIAIKSTSTLLHPQFTEAVKPVSLIEYAPQKLLFYCNLHQQRTTAEADP